MPVKYEFVIWIRTLAILHPLIKKKPVPFATRSTTISERVKLNSTCVWHDLTLNEDSVWPICNLNWETKKRYFTAKSPFSFTALTASHITWFQGSLSLTAHWILEIWPHSVWQSSTVSMLHYFHLSQRWQLSHSACWPMSHTELQVADWWYVTMLECYENELCEESRNVDDDEGLDFNTYSKFES
jgi:hypothetical protein